MLRSLRTVAVQNGYKIANNRKLGMISFYDSQSGQHVEISDEVIFKSVKKDCQEGPKKPHMSLVAADGMIPSPSPSSASILIEDPFVISTTALQTLTGRLADNRFMKIILNVPSSVDADDLALAIEECVWNDVEGLPMAYRLGLRLTGGSLLQEQVATGLRLNIKHFEAREGEDSDFLRHALDSHGAVYPTS